MARRQGATREHVLCDLLPRRNAGAGTFSTQPSGPQFFGRISASLARPVSQWIQALRSLLEIRPNSLRRLASHTAYTTLVVSPCCADVLSSLGKGYAREKCLTNSAAKPSDP